LERLSVGRVANPDDHSVENVIRMPKVRLLLNPPTAILIVLRLFSYKRPVQKRIRIIRMTKLTPLMG